MKQLNTTPPRKESSLSQGYPYILVWFPNVIKKVEWFSLKCRTTKTKVITPTNQNWRKQQTEPISTRPKFM